MTGANGMDSRRIIWGWRLGCWGLKGGLKGGLFGVCVLSCWELWAVLKEDGDEEEEGIEMGVS